MKLLTLIIIVWIALIVLCFRRVAQDRWGENAKFFLYWSLHPIYLILHPRRFGFWKSLFAFFLSPFMFLMYYGVLYIIYHIVYLFLLLQVS